MGGPFFVLMKKNKFLGKGLIHSHVEGDFFPIGPGSLRLRSPSYRIANV